MPTQDRSTMSEMTPACTRGSGNAGAGCAGPDAQTCVRQNPSYWVRMYLQTWVLHCCSSILDHNGLAPKPLQVREGF